MSEQATVASLKGYVASIALSGSVTPQFAACWADMRSYNDKSGLVNVEYALRNGVFVEAARDDVVQHALREKYDWILQIDADATFPPDTLRVLLEQAYILHPDCGVLSAYAQLKAFPHLPTIDTGTGTWEEHYPGEGVLPVIRTGCHCFLVKTQIFGRLGPAPWFRTRIGQDPLKAFREVDGFARRLLSGTNPLKDHPEWDTMLEQATLKHTPEQIVGEDSSFYDRCRAHGVNVMVDTDLVTGHVAQEVIQPNDLRNAVRDNKRRMMLAVGVG